MADPTEPKKPSFPPQVPARTSSADNLPALPRYTGPDPKMRCGLLALPGPSDQVLEVAAYVTADAPAVTVGADAVPAIRGPLRSRLDSTLPPGEKPLPVGGATVFDMELAITRFHDRAYAVARVGPGVDLSDSTESTNTGLQKVAWKLPRPC